MAHEAVPLIRDSHVPVAAALPTRDAVAEVQPRRDGNLLGLAQARDDARLVDEAVGRADAAAEVALEGPDGEVFGDEAQRGCRGEAGAVLGEEVQRWLEVGLVWGSRLEI